MLNMLIYITLYFILPVAAAWKIFPNTNNAKLIWMLLSFVFSWLGLLVSFVLDKFFINPPQK